MWSESQCVALTPPLIILLIHQVGPLNAFDLYFCITSLFLQCPHLFLSLFSITSLTFSNSPDIAASLVCLLLNRSLLAQNISNFAFGVCSSLFSHFISDLSSLYLLLYDPSLSHMIRPPMFLISLSLPSISLPPCFLRSVRPPRTRSGSTCRRWGFSTWGSL